MIFWRLLPHVTACIAGEAIVLLDIRQDRYFLVPPALTAVTADWLSSSGSDQAPAGLLALLDRGGISSAKEDFPRPQASDVLLPITLEENTWRPRIGPIRHARIDFIVATTWLALRTRPIGALLAQATRRTSTVSRLDQSALRLQIAAFDRARRLNPLPRNCLLDSLALQRWLASGGHASRIVFGVTTTPFAAHCWAQDDNAILNDHYDRVSRFAPIYAS